MRKSRFFAAALAFLMLPAVLLTGCAAEKEIKVKLDPDNPVTITIWHYYNGPQKKAFDEMVGEFNETVGKQKGIYVEASSQGNVSELTEKVLASANKKVGAQEIPDVFAAYADTALQVDRLGLVASLDAYLTKAELENYIPGYLEEGRFDAQGNLKIFPIAKSTEVMLMNETAWNKFSAATGASLEALKTMEGLTETARAYYEWTDSLTAQPDDGKAFFGRDAMANYMIIGAKQLGTELFSVQNGQVSFQTDESVMRRLWDNYYVPFVNGWFGAYGRFRSDDAKTGDIIALVGSTSGAAYFPDKVNVSDTESYETKAIVMEPPRFEGEKYAVQQGAGMVVTKSDEKREYAATFFLKWFTDVARNISFSAESGYMPVKKEASSAEKIEQGLADSTSDTLRQALQVAIGMTQTDTMYTNKTFVGGTLARNVLETLMSDYAKADKEKADALVAQGISRKEAAARFTTDENFQAWLTELQSALQATVDGKLES